MNAMKKRFQGLDPWRPAAVAQEITSHVLLVAFALYFGLGYLGLILIFMAEIVLGNLVTAALYPERGARRHAWDLVKIVGVMGFLMVFVIATYLAATDRGGEAAEVWQGLDFDIDAVKAAIAFAVLHLSVLYVLARRDPEPRYAWTRSVLMQNGATLVALFLMIFVAAFAGILVAGAADLLGVANPADTALILCVAALRLGLALLLTRMPAHEARDIAGQPYAD